MQDGVMDVCQVALGKLSLVDIIVLEEVNRHQKRTVCHLITLWRSVGMHFISTLGMEKATL